ncbi:putative quinol monooxygenase [Bergeriella denitrificans]|nr:antibiotic biosynthesis monooxygenase [Bergeriella denitrificans]
MTVLFSAALAAQAAPVFNLFELGVQPAQTERYRQIGEHNIRTSIAREKGTLAMYSLQSADTPNLRYMVEIYADDAAYQAHLQSPQYRTFLAAAPHILTDRKQKTELVPQLLSDKKVFQTASTLTRLTIADIRPEAQQAFRPALRAYAAAAKTAPGLSAVYAATEKNQPNRWYLFEIYENEAAYQAHRFTPHAQAYLSDTADMLLNRQTVALQPLTLGNQGHLAFDADITP